MLVDASHCSKGGGYDPKQATQDTFRVRKRPREEDPLAAVVAYTDDRLESAAKCAFSEADMRRAHALERAARALCREARSSERVSESDCLEIGMFGR